MFLRCGWKTGVALKYPAVAYPGALSGWYFELDTKIKCPN